MIVNMERRHLVVFGLICFGTMSGFMFSWIVDGGQFDDAPVIIKKQVTDRLSDLTVEKLTNDSMSEYTEEKVRQLTNCMDKHFEPKIYQRGDYWVLQNYIRADHGEIHCTESVTYVTHSDYTFLDNLIPVLERWLGPLSMSIYTPGTDLQPTIDSIKYLRQCLPQSHLVQKYATFYIFFDSEHVPDVVPNSNEVLSESYNCSLPAPYLNGNKCGTKCSP